MDIVKKTYSLSKQLPAEEKFGLISQITRASVSIPSNIAEGSGRKSDKEKKWFAEVALGSAFELETQLLIIRDLELANRTDTEEVLKKLHELQPMLNCFITTLSQ
jgi:four helix bundle protein